MNSIIYLGQVTACTAVFYLFYYLFLRKLTFFSINRWYLLSTVLLSFLIPLIKLDINQPKPYTGVVEQMVYTYAPPQTEPPVFIPTPKQVIKSEPINWRDAIRLAYCLAVAGLTIQLLITLVAFYKRLKGKHITKLGNVNILSGNNKISNGSFLNYIFVNEDELSADEIQQIIAHEMMHVRLYHSADRILVKLAQIVLWFNPFIYLYAHSVEENHEFEVDRAVANNTDKHNYANLLLHLSVAGNGMLYHNFSKVPLKKRITMLFIKPTTNMKKVIYLLFVPVVLFSGLAFARLKKDEPKYSAINGVEKLSENVLVMIDGKKYPKEVLYKISPSCMKGWGVFSPDPKLIKYGIPIKDGLVEIKTREGKIVDMSRNEWDNIVKERSVPQSQFYARLHLKYDDGRKYDRVIIHAGKEGGVITNVKPGDKVGALIDEKFYDEAVLKVLSPAIIANLSGNCGVAGASNFPNAPHDYAAIFSLKTLRAQKAPLKSAIKTMPIDTNRSRPTSGQKPTETKKEISGIKLEFPENETIDKVEDLYTRTPVKRPNMDPYEELKVQSYHGSYATTEVKPGGKVGFFIDKVFYTEIQLKTLSSTQLTALSHASVVGVADDRYFAKLAKAGFEADLKGYDAVFYFYIKTKFDPDLFKKQDNNVGKVSYPLNEGNADLKLPKDQRVIITSDSISVKAAEHINEYFGNVKFSYNGIVLTAGYVRLDDAKKMIFASGRPKGADAPFNGRPIVKMGKDDTQIVSDSILVNYQTKGAHVWNSTSPIKK